MNIGELLSGYRVDESCQQAQAAERICDTKIVGRLPSDAGTCAPRNELCKVIKFSAATNDGCIPE